MSALTAILVDDHTVLREALRRALESSGLSVVADMADGVAALEQAVVTRPDVVLMDVSLPGPNGIEITRQLSRRCPETAVVMLTAFADGATEKAAFAAGAVAFLPKDCTTRQLLSTIEQAVHDKANPGHAVPKLHPESVASYGLTAREVEVLEMLANGESNSELAAKLYISGKTVKNHLANIYSKLGVESRTQAVAKAVRLGLVRIA